jgi:hypothetical protein
MGRLNQNYFTDIGRTAEPFTQLYKCLFDMQLDSDSIIIYTLLRDRCKMSADHLDKYRDNDGNLFIYYTVAELMQKINKSNKPISKSLTKLRKRGLIDIVKIKGSNANRIYITDAIEI